MPFFNVMLNGEGVYIAAAGPMPAIVGFYTTRIVHASSEQEAERAAVAMVHRQWLSPEYKSSNTGGAPQLTIESIERTSFWAWLRFHNQGYSFYGSSNDAA